ncbi:hypothetical protein, partial [Mycobacterium avium]|uniref:hypothetical protein n=1 Tax=Mycobacterium avium TaxID=1764 RepID=UPI000A00711F
MKTLASLAEIYAEYDKWEQRLQRARRRREVAERSIERCYKHLAPTVMVEQVAALLRPHFPQYRLRVLGPFGLCSETAIHAYDERGECVGSVAFRPSGNRLNVVDYRRDSGRFAPNTLGALNGLNHPEAAAPTSVAGLVQVLADSIDPPGQPAGNPEDGVIDAIDALVSVQLERVKSRDV